MADTPTCHSLCRCKCGDYFMDHLTTRRAFDPESHDVDCDIRRAELAAKIEACSQCFAAEKAKGGA